MVSMGLIRLTIVFIITMASTVSASSQLLRVGCIGDSITGPGDGPEYVKRYLKWPDLLQFSIDLATGEQCKVRNFGVAGSHSNQALERTTAEVQPWKPDIAIILIGGNDFSVSDDVSTISRRFYASLTAIVGILKDSDTKVLLLQYAEPTALNREGVWEFLDDGNPVIKKVSEEQQVPVLDLGPSFAEAVSTYGPGYIFNDTDGVHLKPLGEIVLAKSVFQKLCELNWLPEK